MFTVRTVLARFTLAVAIVSCFSSGSPGQAQTTRQSGDSFGQELTLTSKNILYLKGSANWDSAFETLVDSFKTLKAFVEREQIKTSGEWMTIYTSTDDTGFQYQAAIAISEEPKTIPRGDIALGKSPEGRALKFTHRGSYDAMDTTYDAITNHLDERRLESQDAFIEEYVTDPLTTPEDKLIVNVLVPLK